MQRNYATLAIVGLSLALSACSKNKEADHQANKKAEEPAAASSYVIKYEAQCAEGADSCVGQHGFAITIQGNTGTYLAGPIPAPAEGEKATREGSLDADKVKLIDGLVAKINTAGQASMSTTELDAALDNAKITIVKGTESQVVISTEGKKLNHRGDAETAQALRNEIFALAEHFYFNSCTDAVLELDAIQTKAKSCNADADCGFARQWVDYSNIPFYEIDAKQGTWIQTASCAQVQPLAVANISFLAKENLLAAHEKAIKACGKDKFSGAGRTDCSDKGFEIGSLAAVCDAGQCRVNPGQSISN